MPLSIYPNRSHRHLRIHLPLRLVQTHPIQFLPLLSNNIRTLRPLRPLLQRDGFMPLQFLKASGEFRPPSPPRPCRGPGPIGGRGFRRRGRSEGEVLDEEGASGRQAGGGDGDGWLEDGPGVCRGQFVGDIVVVDVAEGVEAKSTDDADTK